MGAGHHGDSKTFFPKIISDHLEQLLIFHGRGGSPAAPPPGEDGGLRGPKNFFVPKFISDHFEQLLIFHRRGGQEAPPPGGDGGFRGPKKLSCPKINFRSF